jgi:hypothetical protein
MIHTAEVRYSGYEGVSTRGEQEYLFKFVCLNR